MNPIMEAGRRVEVEIKLPVEDLELVRERLRAQGGRLATEAHFESNDLYDRNGGELATRGCVLRLRRTDRAAVLTFKGPARFEGGTKKREERETAVSEPEELDKILAGLGFERHFRYEKRREEWELESCAIALDETPIGNFVEIEGDPLAIRRVVQRLGLDSSESIPYTYAELYRRRRQENPSLPEAMVFKDR